MTINAVVGRPSRPGAGGGRQQTCDDFCVPFTAPENDAFTVLLVDSEDRFEEGAGP